MIKIVSFNNFKRLSNFPCFLSESHCTLYTNALDPYSLEPLHFSFLDPDPRAKYQLKQKTLLAFHSSKNFLLLYKISKSQINIHDLDLDPFFSSVDPGSFSENGTEALFRHLFTLALTLNFMVRFQLCDLKLPVLHFRNTFILIENPRNFSSTPKTRRKPFLG